MKTKRVLAVVLAATTILGASLTAFATTEAASGSSTPSEPAAPTYAAASVAGVKSTAAGSIVATNIQGAAITTPKESLNSNLGLADGEKAWVKVSNFDAKKSKDAKVVVDAIVSALGVKAGPAVNFECGKMANGKYTKLENGTVSAAFQVDGDFSKGKTLSAIKVTSAGAAILPDTDNNPYTITVNTTVEPQVLQIVAQ
ncbi:MAG: hypothetical protein K5868_02660 [Lachnospiraceae bacterium]|nr:hypothetical protein [Lachnospiraceae bacterium]